MQETGDKVAIKKALQEKKYKNRELQNFKALGLHPNIVELKSAFYIQSQNVHCPPPPLAAWQGDDVYINYVMEYIPETLSQILKSYRRQKKQLT